MTTDSATGTVRRHLQEHLGHTNGLHVETEPGLSGSVVTTVRRSMNAVGWVHSQAEQLAETLRQLPGADVELRPVRDLVRVVWTPAPVEPAPRFMDNPKACGAPEGSRWGYLPCGCSNDGYGNHVR